MQNDQGQGISHATQSSVPDKVLLFNYLHTRVKLTRVVGPGEGT